MASQLENSSRCRYRNVRPHSLPAESHSFVGMARETAAMPPASKEGRTLFDTHTVPLGGACVRNLNRYQKTLRNKRKKDRKSSAKRARENDRCRKMKK